jgi:hypothetical protein
MLRESAESFRRTKGERRLAILHHRPITALAVLKSRFLSDAVLSAKRRGQAMTFGPIININSH